ncbi:hypothetical protein ASG52_20235 [Methylobacterium sp. Leaf456]|uniref:hypothetical protein n=1 Tax=Methylobacterium sp. Leaf456 TaxID=1736382 RepID=UPI0007014601|nr:hypothetical protein [Methylobacterium sp. Leaf456]KQT59716.1 hypothetical protein ASG52_20235 [Methylobacterium sp. Leaf456]
MMGRGLPALGAALILGLVAGPAAAQYRYDDGYGPPRRYAPPPGYYYEPPAPPAHVRRPDGDPRGSLCVTARGSCPTWLAPPNAPCACDIPGFGTKRGGVAPY